MMKCKAMIAIGYVLLLYALTGCQLAMESADANPNEDRLIGVLLTTEHLDLFDFEGYLYNSFPNSQDGEIDADGRLTQQYQGRLYAVLVSRTLTDEETGEGSITHEYVFEGIEGIRFFAPTLQATDAQNSYTATISDPSVSDGHTSIFVGDDESKVSIDGTVFITPASCRNTYYFNPVYQSADGGVYAVTGSGFTIDNEAYTEGSVYAQTMEETTTRIENGTTTKDVISIKITISVMFVPEKRIILQMSSDSKIVSRTEYEPDAMPKVLTLETGTAYFIVETHKRDDTGNRVIAREIYDSYVENIDIFYARADGVCVKHWMQIIGN